LLFVFWEGLGSEWSVFYMGKVIKEFQHLLLWYLLDEQSLHVAQRMRHVKISVVDCKKNFNNNIVNIQTTTETEYPCAAYNLVMYCHDHAVLKK